jgi:hypothetical protein
MSVRNVKIARKGEGIISFALCSAQALPASGRGEQGEKRAFQTPSKIVYASFVEILSQLELESARAKKLPKIIDNQI